MKNTTKAFAIAILLTSTMILGAFFLIPPLSAEEAGQIPSSYLEEKGETPLQNRIVNYWVWRRETLLLKFIRSGTYEPLEGTVSAVTRHILVVESDGKTINVILPGKWVYDEDILETLDLFDGTPFQIGDIVHLETLRLMLEKEDHVITSYLALSVSVSETTASALLPFNVETIE